MQNGIISNAAIKVNYAGDLPEYNKKYKINELAFLITNTIDDICDFVCDLRNSNQDVYNEIIEFTDKNFNITNFCLTDLTEKFNLSRKTVTNVFKQMTGMTFQEYIENKRIEMAKYYLAETDNTISEIANQCGYGTENAFYKSFKKSVGITPGTYRKSHAKKN